MSEVTKAQGEEKNLTTVRGNKEILRCHTLF